MASSSKIIKVSHNVCEDRCVLVFIIANMVVSMLYKLGDNCIQNFHLDRYIVRYTVENLVLRQRVSVAVNMISKHTSNDMHPQMKLLNMVIPILIHFCSFVSNWSVASRIKPHIIK